MDDENLSLDPDILQYVRCPVTKTQLRFADSEVVESLNSRIEAGQLVNRIGETVKAKLDGGLLNQDGSMLLPVRGGILTLVSDEAIELEQT
ncbi:MAG: Trm112 family protein [Planctomycetota bacterium]